MTYIFAGLAIYLITANILVTHLVWRDPRRTAREKIAETGLIWLAPFFGHLLALAIFLDGPETLRRSDPTITAAGVVGAISSNL